MPDLPDQVLWALGGIFAALILATVVVRIVEHGNEGPSELRDRTRSWWFMIIIFTIAMVTWREVSSIFLAFVSFMALKEYLSLIPTRRIDRWLLIWAYLAIPVQFYWAHDGWYTMFLVFIPVWMFLFFPIAMALRGETAGFLRAVGTISWGLMICVFAISHTAMLLGSDEVMEHPAKGAGVLLFLVVSTQFNDVAQFTWGKLCRGRFIGRIVPNVSPNKTWEGFLGGLFSTAILGALMAPHLTAMPFYWGAIAGLVIATAGFSGDITMSALKRDLKVKDASHLIPGHGGILDRVDSLTYSAPVFFHFYYFFFVSGYPGTGWSGVTNRMTGIIQILFFALIVRPVLMIVLGVHVRRRELLPRSGPAVLIANHNSHLDTLLLMALYPLDELRRVRPVAAMDYFMTSGFMRWVAFDLIGIIPVDRRTGVKDGGNPLSGALEALDRGQILILFPEGSRGQPETLATFKKGIAHLSAARPDVPVTPVFTHGLGKSLPKGSFTLVPFNCDVFVGEALHYPGSIEAFMGQMQAAMETLAAEGEFPAWD